MCSVRRRSRVPSRDLPVPVWKLGASRGRCASRAGVRTQWEGRGSCWAPAVAVAAAARTLACGASLGPRRHRWPTRLSNRELEVAPSCRIFSSRGVPLGNPVGQGDERGLPDQSKQGASPLAPLLRNPGGGAGRGRARGACPDPTRPPTAPRHEGQGPQALLQGHRARQGDDPHRGLRRLPVSRPPQPALHRPHPEHVGVVGQQHGGPRQVVLPPRGDQPGQAPPRGPGGPGPRRRAVLGGDGRGSPYPGVGVGVGGQARRGPGSSRPLVCAHSTGTRSPAAASPQPCGPPARGRTSWR